MNNAGVDCIDNGKYDFKSAVKSDLDPALPARRLTRLLAEHSATLTRNLQTDWSLVRR